MFRLLIILSLTMSHQVNASVFGGTNFGFSGYPEHECNKPTKPYKPFNFSSQWEVDSYNTDVERYNNDLRVFVDCIEEYVDNANNDIKRIRENANAAIDEANE